MTLFFTFVAIALIFWSGFFIGSEVRARFMYRDHGEPPWVQSFDSVKISGFGDIPIVTNSHVPPGQAFIINPDTLVHDGKLGGGLFADTTDSGTVPE